MSCEHADLSRGWIDQNLCISNNLSDYAAAGGGPQTIAGVAWVWQSRPKAPRR